jgi:S-formylglutathione hydrolase FrmB
VFLLLTLVVLFSGFLFSGAGFEAAQSVQQTQVAGPVARDYNKRVEIVSLDSKLVGETLPYIVVLPVEYDQRAAQSKRYPVLYLLHGLGGHYDNWTTKTKLANYAAQYQMIVVTPEANNGWYTDSATVSKNKYETYVFEELIPDVQRRYRTLETRAGRGIGGLSMGGYGALKFGIKFPQTFAFAGSVSGALGAASWSETDLRGHEAIWRSLVPVFGATDSSTRAANDLTKLVRELPGDRISNLPFLYVDCGTEDPFLKSNVDFAELLRSRKIRHEYRELPGGHAWNYWDAEVQEILRLAAKEFQSDAAQTAPIP